VRKLIVVALIIATAWFADDCAHAAEIKAPDKAVAGQPVSIPTSGSGSATVYLIGPGEVIKRKVELGQPLQLKAGELRTAGRWIASIEGSGHPQSVVFWVSPGPVRNLSFLARPSRVPVARPNVISGVAYVFDQNHNLVLQPTAVNFSLSVSGSGVKRSVSSSEGIAWINTSSAAKAGAAQFVASVGDSSVTRIVQQVAGNPCNLRMRVAQRTADALVLETDPVRDCTGNPVPDGTIVTFIENDKQGKSTVDARIKKGVARAELPATDNGTITVAAGVVLGNELRLGGGQ